MGQEPEKFILNDLFIPKIFYSVTGGEDTSDQFTTMKPFSFFTYEGSLTMPPCSESTIHYVASEVLPIGSVVLDLAMEALRMPDMKSDDSTGQSTTIRDLSVNENYRATQDKNQRSVYTHIFVPGSHPSGIPGAYLESRDDAYGVV